MAYSIRDLTGADLDEIVRTKDGSVEVALLAASTRSRPVAPDRNPTTERLDSG